MNQEHVLELVNVEVLRACNKHAPMNSHHEAYGVILEELDEYWDEVKKGGQTTPRIEEALRTELIHTAAMAIRALIDLCE